MVGSADSGTDTYSYDFENRLIGLVKGTSGGAGTYAYGYDYRTRRVVRDESAAGGAVTSLVFSGGTSVQEYDNSATSPTVEYIRGSDYGGGVGGILYTLRGGNPSYTHENRRGDVVAKTDGSGSLTYQAQYEGFGKQVATSGSTQDRQKSNSKDTDPTGLVDEGFRYRDLETGMFVNRDPAGFVDGPNLYSYVRCNPWTHFDPEGLDADDDQMKRNADAAMRYAQTGPPKSSTATKILSSVFTPSLGTDSSPKAPTGSGPGHASALLTVTVMQSVADTMSLVNNPGKALTGQSSTSQQFLNSAATSNFTSDERLGAGLTLGATTLLLPELKLGASLDVGKTAEVSGATVGKALTNDYRSTFLEANPGLDGQVVVHHAVEQQVLTRYPGLFDESEIHSLENLRGIPNELNSDVHLSQIRRDWNQFYRTTPNPTREQFLQRATNIDSKFGSQFSPPVGQ